uniref:Uncharacterized protein n=1 Tax=Ditylum brightwellii TaxID=49249 RepID=A0A6S8QU26_9STRA|mmetsp:Transcript_27453/g.41110  ORF Transcript_27453/g.41110 Transcript_27453/m.41110 type:complete len:121 (-) Transcript_27453:10-372(-)
MSFLCSSLNKYKICKERISYSLKVLCVTISRNEKITSHFQICSFFGRATRTFSKKYSSHSSVGNIYHPFCGFSDGGVSALQALSCPGRFLWFSASALNHRKRARAAIPFSVHQHSQLFAN